MNQTVRFIVVAALAGLSVSPADAARRSVYFRDGKVIAKPAASVLAKDNLECFVVPCPAGWGKEIVCWQCRTAGKAGAVAAPTANRAKRN